MGFAWIVMERMRMSVTGRYDFSSTGARSMQSRVSKPSMTLQSATNEMRYTPAKDGVFLIKLWLLGIRDEELRAVCVGTIVRHRDNASRTVLASEHNKGNTPLKNLGIRLPFCDPESSSHPCQFLGNVSSLFEMVLPVGSPIWKINPLMFLLLVAHTMPHLWIRVSL